MLNLIGYNFVRILKLLAGTGVNSPANTNWRRRAE